MPFRILSLGKSKSQAGLFLGFITYASAFSAPLGGALADRVGKKPILLASSAAILCFSLVYAQATQLWLILLTAVVHGVFWSALLASSAAMMIGIIPDTRRAEGLGYWGLASTLAIAAAPAAGLWLLRRGWGWLCFCMGSLAVGMFLIALRFPEKRVHRSGGLEGLLSASLIEKRVFLLALTLFLYTFGYGGITSFVALYTRDSGVRPEGLFFSIFSVVIIATRPFLGRLADKKGRTRVMFPCLVLIAIGMGVLAISARLPFLVTSAVLFGIGFGSAYPAFAAYILEHVDARRRGAAFGSILLAVDTGIGTGSILLGVVVEHFGYRPAFALGGLMALGAIPYFRFAEQRLAENDSLSH
jgi:MFS family permease